MYPYYQSSNGGHDTRGFMPGPGGFPGGFPGGPGGFPPPPPPGGGGGAAGAPTSPPPSFIPPEPAIAPFAVDPSSIRGCLFRNTYIWQDNGDQYWMFLTHVGRTSISGFRWYGFGPAGFWLFFGLDLRRIRQFTCF